MSRHTLDCFNFKEIRAIGNPYFNRIILPSVLFNLALVPVVYVFLYLIDRRTARARLEW